MTQTATLAALRQPPPAEVNMPAVSAGFFNLQSFELIQRVAKAFAMSDLVPKQYQDNIPNCMIALDMAQRMGANPLMVMQNLYIVHGTPGWSSKFLIATINVCGRFSALRYEWKGEPGKADYGCRAWAIERATNERLDGIWVTWEMVLAEGWSGKNGSKWKTMPDQMFVYRAAAFWQRAYAPELGMGLQTAEEAEDFIEARPDGSGAYTTDLDALREQVRPVEPEPVVEPVAVVEEPAPEPAPPSKATPAKSAAPPTATQSSPPPTLAEVLSLVADGDFLIARDMARGLGDTARADVEKAIADAMAKRSAKPRQPDLADQ
ncbi:hypothetical protein [Chitinimonas lacunae]|uniref:Recombinase RecT n=1 Tax=Chitinimonas lacunae TaxID=1963018 RepID=A0ABV8MJB5_9NEIS